MRRLVVAGGGMAGLLAAAAIAPHVDEVVVADGRGDGDPVPVAPQSGQLHNVLTRGQRHLEELLPGFRRRVLEAGVVEGSVADDTHVFEFGGRVRERPLGLVIWSAPWALLWDTARSLLPGNVRRVGSTVERLIAEDGTVRGATLRSARGVVALDADGVVDATGYGLATDALLQSAGLPTPEVTERRLERWFVTTRWRRPTLWHGATDFWMVFTEPPDRHVALVSPFRDDEWFVSISSESARRPPRDLATFGAFLDELPGPPLRPLIEEATPLGEPTVFRRRTARWRHFEADTDHLDGYVPIGDSYAAIDPVYGQGVGVAAWQASLLRKAVGSDTASPSWTRRYVADAADVVAQAWALADMPLPSISEAEWARVAASLAQDVERQRRYVGLWHLMEPPTAFRTLVAEVTPGHATDTTGRRQ